MHKYSSLGNNFILFAAFVELSSAEIIKLCRANKVDGILILKNDSELLIFNADGTRAEKCFNGIRIAAKFLYFEKKFPNNFFILMGGTKVAVAVDKNQVSINVGKINYIGVTTIKTPKTKLEFQGHVVDAGNPHFVILQKTDLANLKIIGPEIEAHEYFPNKTNVEFLWPDANGYKMLVYERGVGITAACGTGAAAALQVLLTLKIIKTDEKIKIAMPGGSLVSWCDNSGNVFQQTEID